MATSNINSQNSMAATTDDGTDEEEEEEASAMSLIDHLEELRWRILKTLIAIVVGGIIAFFFRDQIIQFLVLPLPDQASVALGIHTGHKLFAFGLAEGFTVYLKLSLAAGILLALPVLLYQTWAFVSPGLRKEIRCALHFRWHRSIPGRNRARIHRTAFSSAMADQHRFRQLHRVDLGR